MKKKNETTTKIHKETTNDYTKINKINIGLHNNLASQRLSQNSTTTETNIHHQLLRINQSYSIDTNN